MSYRVNNWIYLFFLALYLQVAYNSLDHVSKILTPFDPSSFNPFLQVAYSSLDLVNYSKLWSTWSSFVDMISQGRGDTDTDNLISWAALSKS